LRIKGFAGVAAWSGTARNAKISAAEKIPKRLVLFITSSFAKHRFGPGSPHGVDLPQARKKKF